MGSLTGAAAAALGVQPPSPTPERLAWVDVEWPPRMTAIVDPASGEPLGYYAQFDDDLPLTDLMADKARAICDVVDENGCEAEGCDAAIGWMLVGEADERTEWARLALVQRGREVIAVCGECSPSALYQRLRDGA